MSKRNAMTETGEQKISISLENVVEIYCFLQKVNVIVAGKRKTFELLVCKCD